MIEPVLVQPDDLSIPAFVIGMTLTTILFACGLVFAMESGWFRYVGSYVLVAVEAQLLLRRILQTGMALMAILLQILMSGDHRPRHEQFFKIERIGRKTDHYQQYCKQKATHQ
jgi:hypothetical protein